VPAPKADSAPHAAPLRSTQLALNMIRRLQDIFVVFVGNALPFAFSGHVGAFPPSERPLDTLGHMKETPRVPPNST
jgi:hypothetical protein